MPWRNGPPPELGGGGTDPRRPRNAYVKGLMNKQQCSYPSAKGQQLIAQLLLQTGLAPLRWQHRPSR